MRRIRYSVTLYASIFGPRASPRSFCNARNFDSGYDRIFRYHHSETAPSNIHSTLNDFIDKVRDGVTSSKRPNSQTKATLRELTHQLFALYPRLPPLKFQNSAASCDRQQVMKRLIELHPNEQTIQKAIDHYQMVVQEKDPDTRQTIQSLHERLTPFYHTVFQYLLNQNNKDAIRFILDLRQDILRLLPTTAHHDDYNFELKTLDRHLQSILSTWFAPGLLRLQRITYEETPAAMIEQMAKYEAVHPVQSLQDLRQRLGPTRRVFGLVHPLLPNQLLVVLHVSLQHEIPDAMNRVHESAVSSQNNPTVATFYSISNLQPGLAGVGLGEYVIHEATEMLRTEIPSLQTFVTLSPIPRFRKWLEERVSASGKFAPDRLISNASLLDLAERFGCRQEEALRVLVERLEHGDIVIEDDQIKEVLSRLACRYLLREKHRRRPLDAVARFHIGNGAVLHRINPAADPTRKGYQNSYGVMVNYVYHLDQLATNQAQYEIDYSVPASPSVQLLDDSTEK